MQTAPISFAALAATDAGVRQAGIPAKIAASPASTIVSAVPIASLSVDLIARVMAVSCPGVVFAARASALLTSQCGCHVCETGCDREKRSSFDGIGETAAIGGGVIRFAAIPAGREPPNILGDRGGADAPAPSPDAGGELPRRGPFGRRGRDAQGVPRAASSVVLTNCPTPGSRTHAAPPRSARGSHGRPRSGAAWGRPGRHPRAARDAGRASRRPERIPPSSASRR